MKFKRKIENNRLRFGIELDAYVPYRADRFEGWDRIEGFWFARRGSVFPQRQRLGFPSLLLLVMVLQLFDLINVWLSYPSPLALVFPPPTAAREMN